MKKLTVMLSFLVLMVFIGMSDVLAVAFVKSGNKYVSNADISGGRYGTFKAGDVSYEYTDEENGIKKWEFYLTPSSNVKSIYMLLSPSDSIQIQSIKAGSSFLLASEESASAGRNLLLVANNPSGVTSGSKVLLFTVTTKDLAETGCMLSVGPLVLDCMVVDGNYFDDDGNMTTEEEYNRVCNGVTPEDPVEPDEPNEPGDEPNPDTGSVIPYVAVGGGLLAIVALYMLSKKSNKMFKI